MVCGATVFLLFWLHQDNRSLVSIHLALFYYLSIIIADQNMSVYGQVGRVCICQISIQLTQKSVIHSRQSGHSDDVYYVWGLPHVYEVTMFILHRNRCIYFKVSGQIHKASIVFFLFNNSFGWDLADSHSCSSSLSAAYKLNETGKSMIFQRDSFKVQL